MEGRTRGPRRFLLEVRGCTSRAVSRVLVLSRISQRKWVSVLIHQKYIVSICYKAVHQELQCCMRMEKQKRNSMILPEPSQGWQAVLHRKEENGFALETIGLSPKSATLSLITTYSHAFSSYRVEMLLHSLNFHEVKGFTYKVWKIVWVQHMKPIVLS